MSPQWERERLEMVQRQIDRRGGIKPRVLDALRQVPRHRFVPEKIVDSAYTDQALRVGHGVTISQPFVVALMSSLANITPGDRVLEVGTGTGYQSAVLAQLGADVTSIERIGVLAESAEVRLRELKYAVDVHHGDGYFGWPERAPFKAIVITAAPPELPWRLVEQLALGGRLIAPVGQRFAQSLTVVERSLDDETSSLDVADVAFVPMLAGICRE